MPKPRREGWPADLVRDLANQPGTLFYRVFTDPAGRILDRDRHPRRHLPVPHLFETRDRVRQRPRHPHPRGPTTGSNLRALCRRHHNMKTYTITEPTEHVMRDPAPSKAEHDLATFITHIEYAA